MTMNKKVVRISESNLVDVIEKIVNETIKEKKRQAIAESQKKAKKQNLSEAKINAMVDKVIERLTKKQ